MRCPRVKGRTEKAIISAFSHGCALRPDFVLPSPKARSKAAAYRWGGAVVTPLIPLLRLRGLRPVPVTDTAELGRVALHLARRGHPRRVLENRDINRVATLWREGRVTSVQATTGATQWLRRFRRS